MELWKTLKINMKRMKFVLFLFVCLFMNKLINVLDGVSLIFEDEW